jgi:alpha-beta hydrolase superfamily lysophospholipase
VTLPASVAKLFPDGKPLFYQATFNGKAFAKHWAMMQANGPNPSDGYTVQLVLEMDPKVVGRGGSLVKQRCQLQLDGDFRPLRYITEAQGARVLLEIGAEEIDVTLPDGAKPKVPRKDAEWIVEANLTGLDALFYMLAFSRGRLGDETSFTLFLLNQLITIPQKLTRVAPGVWKSGYDEEIRINDDGVLQSISVAKQGVVSELAEPPPLPEWLTAKASTVPKDIVRYKVPENATFRSEEMSVAAPLGPIGANLTIPKGTGPFPAVLFLSGTGKHDRHGIAGEVDLGTHEIVDFLSEHGFVGLRFDTRGAGKTKMDPALSSSLRPLLEDARACLTYLRARPEVDPARICLVGHSQGGLVALVLANETHDPGICAVALMASVGRRIDEILEEQIVAQARNLNLTDAQRDKQLSEFHDFIANVRAGKSFEAGQVPDHVLPLTRMTDWIKEHLALEATTLIRTVHCPVLVCQGSKDFQVTLRDAELLYEAGKAAGVPVEREVLTDLDHLFKHTEGESKVEQYYDRSRHVDGAFLERLRGWLAQRVS